MDVGSDTAGGYCQYLEDEIKRTQSDNDWLRQQIDTTRSDNKMLKEELGETTKKWDSPESRRNSVPRGYQEDRSFKQIGRENSYMSSQRGNDYFESSQPAHRGVSRRSRDDFREGDEFSTDESFRHLPDRSRDPPHRYDSYREGSHVRNQYPNRDEYFCDDYPRERDSRERSRHSHEMRERPDGSYHGDRYQNFERSSSYQRSIPRERSIGRKSYGRRDSYNRYPTSDYNINNSNNNNNTNNNINRYPNRRNNSRDNSKNVEQQYLRDSYNSERNRHAERSIRRYDSYDDHLRRQQDDSFTLDQTYPVDSGDRRSQHPLMNITIKTFNGGRSGESSLRIREGDDVGEILLRGQNFKPTQIEKDETHKWSSEELIGKTFADLNITEGDVIVLSKDDHFEGDWEGTGGLFLHGEARIGGRLVAEMIERQHPIDMLSCGTVEWYCITRFGRQIIDSNILSYVPSPDDLGSRIQVVFTSDDGETFRVTSPMIIILPSIHNLEVLGTLQTNSTLSAVFDLSGGECSEVTWWCSSTLHDAPSPHRRQRLATGTFFRLQSHHIGMEIRCEVTPQNGNISGTPSSVTCGVVTRAAPVVKDLSLTVMNNNQIHPVAIIDNISDEELLPPRVQWVIDKTTLSKDSYFTFNKCDTGKFLECKYTIRTSDGYCGETANAAVRVPPCALDDDVISEGCPEPSQELLTPQQQTVTRQPPVQWCIEFLPETVPGYSTAVDSERICAIVQNSDTGETDEDSFYWTVSSQIPMPPPSTEPFSSPSMQISVSDVGKIVTCNSKKHPNVRKSFFVNIDTTTATALASSILEGIKGFNLIIGNDKHHLILTHKYIKLLRASSKEVLHKSKWSPEFRVVDGDENVFELQLTSKKDLTKTFKVEAKTQSEKADLILSFRAFQGVGLSSMCREVFGEVVSSGSVRDINKWQNVQTAYETYISPIAASPFSSIRATPERAIKLLQSIESKGKGWVESWLVITTVVRALHQ